MLCASGRKPRPHRHRLKRFVSEASQALLSSETTSTGLTVALTGSPIRRIRHRQPSRSEGFPAQHGRLISRAAGPRGHLKKTGGRGGVYPSEHPHRKDQRVRFLPAAGRPFSSNALMALTSAAPLARSSLMRSRATSSRSFSPRGSSVTRTCLRSSRLRLRRT